jgi:hypothetical protein
MVHQAMEDEDQVHAGRWLRPGCGLPPGEILAVRRGDEVECILVITTVTTEVDDAWPRRPRSGVVHRPREGVRPAF